MHTYITRALFINVLPRSFIIKEIINLKYRKTAPRGSIHLPSLSSSLM